MSKNNPESHICIIEISLEYCQIVDNIMIQEAAVNDIISSVTTACQKILIPLKEKTHQFWQYVSKEYSLDVDKNIFTYDPVTQKITGRLKEAED